MLQSLIDMIGEKKQLVLANSLLILALILFLAIRNSQGTEEDG